MLGSYRVLWQSGVTRLSLVLSRRGDCTYKNQSYITSNQWHLGTFPQDDIQAFYPIALRRKIYDYLEALQEDLEEWLVEVHNTKGTRQGKMYYGMTPIPIEEKQI